MSTQQTVRDAGQQAVDKQSPWLRRKDTLTALVTLVAYLGGGLPQVDWSDPASWAPYVGSVIVAVVGIGIHALTQGSVTPKVVERIAAQADEVTGRHRTDVG